MLLSAAGSAWVSLSLELKLGTDCLKNWPEELAISWAVVCF
jgi:hypothetical protein